MGEFRGRPAINSATNCCFCVWASSSKFYIGLVLVLNSIEYSSDILMHQQLSFNLNFSSLLLFATDNKDSWPFSCNCNLFVNGILPNVSHQCDIQLYL